MKETTAHRCGWAESDPLLRAYHDEEWGVPEYDSRALLEKLMLDGFQAGLSWLRILRKRDAFRKAFKNFDLDKVARFCRERILCGASLAFRRNLASSGLKWLNQPSQNTG